LDRLGRGQTVGWGALFAAVGATAFCSGVLYNWAGKTSFDFPTDPVVSSLRVVHTGKRVTAWFQLDEQARVTVQVRRLRNGRAGTLLNQVSRKLAPGRRRIALAARGDGDALRKGVYQVRVTARATGGELSVPKTAEFRVK
jgi:hypothetical protein